MTTEHFYPESLDDEYMDIMRLMDNLSTVKIKIKVRKALIYKRSKSEHKTKVDEDYIASTSEEVIHLEEQKKKLQDKIASFPPLPVLPPPAPLIKISGTVDEISYTKALACFDVGAYTTMQEQLERKRRRDNIGTSVAMVAQVLAGSAPHVGKTDNVWQREKSVYVQGKIDGKPFSGWVTEADIQPGERIDMAAMPEGEGYLVYAILVPERDVAFLPPKCYRGKTSTGISDYIKSFTIAYILLSPFSIIILCASLDFFNTLLFSVIFTMFVGLPANWLGNKKRMPHWLFFNKIDDALHLDGFNITDAKHLGVFKKEGKKNKC